jgi:hypothetical protein
MKTQSPIRNVNLYSETTKKSNLKKNPSTNHVNKPELSEEIIERCRANLVNYYVCYGSAVVSVRNAERKIIY